MSIDERPSAGLLTRWEALVQAAPDHPAVIDAVRGWSRAELWQQVRAIAAGLRRAGVGEGAVVALGGRRDACQVAAWWACWSVGAAVLPLEPTLPLLRKQAMVAAAQARWLLGAAAEPALPGVVPLSLAALAQTPMQTPTGPASVRLPDDAQRLAYVLFTSGSTGTPKGVAVDHAALLARFDGMQQALPLQPEDRVLHRTPMGFDVAVEELCWPMLAGATIVCQDSGGELDAARLLDTIAAHAVTVIDVMPCLHDRLLQHPAPAPASLRRVLCGGEAMPAALVQRHHARWPAVRLANVYGPTEAVVNALWWESDARHRGAPPLGLPLPGTDVAVRDARQRPVPPGQVGELWLAGPLARGYIGQPALTAERFQTGADGRRWYRTGDQVSVAADGGLAFHGRVDHQVKLRGARIELAEVEAALCRLDGVRQACVLVHGEGRAAQLVAWLACATPRPAAQWRALLAERLPAWMQPARYHHLDELPLTAVGKVDRAALQAGSGAAVPARRGSLRQPLACALRRLWRQVLHCRRVGDDDDFFALGGDSLLAVELLERIEAELGLVLRTEDLYAHGTVRALTTHLRAQPCAPAPFNLARELTEPTAAATGAPNLQVLREAAGADEGTVLVCLHPGDGGTSMYLPLLRFMHRRPRVLAFAAWDLQRRPWPRRTVQEIAADYAQQLQRAQPEGTLHLFGWSAGAVLGHEMAEQLESAGRRVAAVGMADPFIHWGRRVDGEAPGPWSCADAPLSVDDWSAVLAMLAWPRTAPGDVPGFATLSPVAQAEAMLHAVRATGRVPGRLSLEAFQYLCGVVHRHCQAYDRYQPTAVQRDMTLFLPRAPADAALFASHWPAMTRGRCRIVITGGEHMTMIRAPFVQAIAREMDGWFAAALR